MDLAIFDLDNTLLAGDSDYTWGNFLVLKGIVDAEAYQQRNDHFYLEYQRKALDIFEYQRFVLAPLTQLSDAERSRLHAEFMESHIAPLRQDKADDLLEKHRLQGDTLLVITATNHFIAAPIVQSMGVDHLLATDPEIIDGQFTGDIVGIPCFQEGKIQRLLLWLEQQAALSPGLTFDSMTFYSDSINDMPLLDYVDNAIAVDPDDDLRQLAENKSWPIISLRHNLDSSETSTGSGT